MNEGFLPIICPEEISPDDWKLVSWDHKYHWYKEHCPDSFYFRAILRMEVLDRKRLMPRFEFPYVLLAEFQVKDALVANQYCPADIWTRTNETIVPSSPDNHDDRSWEKERQQLNMFWFPQEPHDIVKIRNGVAEWRAAQRSGDIT